MAGGDSMGPLIQKRCVQPILVYPFLGTIRGERQFGKPYKLEVFLCEKSSVIFTPTGSEIKTKNAIYMDASIVSAEARAKVTQRKDDITDEWVNLTPEEIQEVVISGFKGRYRYSNFKRVQGPPLKKEDEVEIEGIGRVPVQQAMRRPCLRKTEYSLEALL